MARYTLIRKGTQLRSDFKRVPVEGGFTTVRDGLSEAAFTVELSEEELRYLIDRASRNKGKKAKSGPIQVKVTRVSKVKEVAA